MMPVDDYMETDFKETEVGLIPVEWDIVELGDMADYLNGAAFKPSDWSDRGLPIVRIQNLTGTSDKFNYFEGEKKDRYRINNGDLLISWSASLGAFLWHRGEAWLNQHIFKVDNRCAIIIIVFFVRNLLILFCISISDSLSREAVASSNTIISLSRYISLAMEIR